MIRSEVQGTARGCGRVAGHLMKRLFVLSVASTVLAGVAAYLSAAGKADDESTPVYVDKIPAGYRDWRLISVAREEGNLNDVRAILGNDIAIKAYREKKLPFPEGTIIAALHWQHVSSEENNKALGHSQSFVAGPPTSMQFMVKDSQKYASTAGWGFAQFTNGKPDSEALHKTCFSCHGPAKAHDFLFTHYAR